MTTLADSGRDLACVDDLDPTLRETTGVETFQHALARRLSTPRGWLLDDPGYGFDVRDELGAEVTRSDVPRLGAAVRGEVLKDDRVLTASVRTVVSGPPSAQRLQIMVTGEAAEGPYDFTLDVTKVSVALINPGAA